MNRKILARPYPRGGQQPRAVRALPGRVHWHEHQFRLHDRVHGDGELEARGMGDDDAFTLGEAGQGLAARQSLAYIARHVIQ